MRAVSILILLLLLFGPVQAATGPEEVIRSGTDRILGILNDESLNEKERRKRIRENVNQYFDFERMAMSALGHHWKDQPADKQKEFVDLFSQFLFETYVDKVESHSAPEEIVYGEHNIKGDRASVDTQVVTQDGQTVPIAYRRIREGGNWQVYDVLVEGVSLIRNYRTQFNSILTSKSFDHLLDQLREKVSG